MRPIGYSTGALAFADFRRGVELVRNRGLRYIELSALRQTELLPLFQGLDQLDLSGFSYVSIHAPGKFNREDEAAAVDMLEAMSRERRPIVVHPDAVHDFSLWRRLGDLLCVENMDGRKALGRDPEELKRIFDRLPDAAFCFDLGHARQIDPSMSMAFALLEEFGHRLVQVHLSNVSADFRHNPLSADSIRAYRKIADLIPGYTPIILESIIDENGIEAEIERALEALPARKKHFAVQ